MTFDVRACGARIRELRMKNGLTQETLAEDLNITDVHLRRIESGVRGGSIELLIPHRACRLFLMFHWIISSSAEEGGQTN